MIINKVVIQNFKGFKDRFTLDLSSGLNIIVGDNEAGKSTILEAINLALSGILGGRYIRNEINQYIFNESSVNEYIQSLNTNRKLPPPAILIELYFKECDELAFFLGDDNSEGHPHRGIYLTIKFDEDWSAQYVALVKTGSVRTLPIEYYRVSWRSFSRKELSTRTIPLKAAFIDSSSTRFQNGSDVYISKIAKELLSDEEAVNVSQAHRQMKEHFMDAVGIKAINKKISSACVISEKTVSISVELSSSNAWESGLTTYLDNIPFHFVGKGEQCIVKTNLALSHDKTNEANVLLIEEPENHLSHSKLNKLIKKIKDSCSSKQIVMTTHSSFVANKLGLGALIFLDKKKTVKLSHLDPDTNVFFEKISGYDTLRLVLSKKTILVEGDSDELIVQKAYMQMNSGRLPIEDEIEVISVGTSFVRFLELADLLSKPVCVVTDNDGNIAALEKKYKDYLNENAKDHIKICFDKKINKGNLELGEKKFNYNTLEPVLLRENSLDILNSIFKTLISDVDEMHAYMHSKKTDCALKIFQSDVVINIPAYISEAII
ncbi:MAG: AAA family ATPase [Burkholderiales bacterium]|nr:AAA family ATPase [Burkholderiales bacterium]